MVLFGLASEVGELINIIKKVRYHGHTVSSSVIREELGDILWYLAETCTLYGPTLSGIAEDNIAKLRERYPNGFSSKRSINRDEYEQKLAAHVGVSVEDIRSGKVLIVDDHEMLQSERSINRTTPSRYCPACNVAEGMLHSSDCKEVK